jgi:hypothetical protein
VTGRIGCSDVDVRGIGLLTGLVSGRVDDEWRHILIRGKVVVGGLIVSLLELKDFFTEDHDDARIWLRIAWTATRAPYFP